MGYQQPLCCMPTELDTTKIISDGSHLCHPKYPQQEAGPCSVCIQHSTTIALPHHSGLWCSWQPSGDHVSLPCSPRPISQPLPIFTLTPWRNAHQSVLRLTSIDPPSSEQETLHYEFLVCRALLMLSSLPQHLLPIGLHPKHTSRPWRHELALPVCSTSLKP